MQETQVFPGMKRVPVQRNSGWVTTRRALVFPQKMQRDFLHIASSGRCKTFRRRNVLTLRVRPGVLQNDERLVKLCVGGNLWTSQKRGGGFPPHVAFQDRLRRAAQVRHHQHVQHLRKSRVDIESEHAPSGLHILLDQDRLRRMARRSACGMWPRLPAARPARTAKWKPCRSRKRARPWGRSPMPWPSVSRSPVSGPSGCWAGGHKGRRRSKSWRAAYIRSELSGQYHYAKSGSWRTRADLEVCPTTQQCYFGCGAGCGVILMPPGGIVAVGAGPK